MLTLTFVAVSVQAFDISYSAKGENELNKAFADRPVLMKKLDAKGLRENRADERQQAYQQNKAKLMAQYPQAEEIPSKGKITCDGVVALKGVLGRPGVAEPKSIASDFARNVIPDVLGEGEEIKVLFVRDEYGADQEKDTAGNIKTNVNIKTYSYSVTMGRTLYGKPIFDSIATVDIDAATHKVVSFDLVNWKPVAGTKTSTLNNINPATIRNMIDKRLNAYQPKAKNIKRVKVENIQTGWVFNGSDGTLIPAFNHSGSVDEIDENGGLVENKYAFLESIKDSTDTTSKTNAGPFVVETVQPEKPILNESSKKKQ